MLVLGCPDYDELYKLFRVYWTMGDEDDDDDWNLVANYYQQVLKQLGFRDDGVVRRRRLNIGSSDDDWTIIIMLGFLLLWPPIYLEMYTIFDYFISAMLWL